MESIERVERQIYIDLRQQLYPLMGDLIEQMLKNYEEGKLQMALNNANSIKMVVSGEMNDTEREFFSKFIQKLYTYAGIAYQNNDNTTAAAISKREETLQKLNEKLGLFIEYLFMEMKGQGIWFPKSKKHGSFVDQIMDETFGTDDKEFNDRIHKVSELESSELVQHLTKDQINKIYTKLVIKDVLQE